MGLMWALLPSFSNLGENARAACGGGLLLLYVVRCRLLAFAGG